MEMFKDLTNRLELGENNCLKLDTVPIRGPAVLRIYGGARYPLKATLS
jgi:hypothetical protein